jgi:hypothetical protein
MSIFKSPKSRFIFSQEADVIQAEDDFLDRYKLIKVEEDFLNKYKFEKERFYRLLEEDLIAPYEKDITEKIFHELENPGSFPEIVPRIGDPKKKMLEKIHFTNLVALSKRQHIKD